LKLLDEENSMRRLQLGGLATPDSRNRFAAWLVLLAIFVWLHRVSWPFSWGDNYELEGERLVHVAAFYDQNEYTEPRLAHYQRLRGDAGFAIGLSG
jgi:hypothetical protein